MRPRKEKLSDLAQTNIQFPSAWKEQLRILAREFAFKRNRDINYQDLIREAMQKQYNLKDEND